MCNVQEYGGENKLQKEDQKIYIQGKFKGLAIAFGLKPSQLFNYLYGDGERPLVGLVPDSKKKGESEGEEE